MLRQLYQRVCVSTHSTLRINNDLPSSQQPYLLPNISVMHLSPYKTQRTTADTTRLRHRWKPQSLLTPLPPLQGIIRGGLGLQMKQEVMSCSHACCYCHYVCVCLDMKFWRNELWVCARFLPSTIFTQETPEKIINQAPLTPTGLNHDIHCCFPLKLAIPLVLSTYTLTSHYGDKYKYGHSTTLNAFKK